MLITSLLGEGNEKIKQESGMTIQKSGLANRYGVDV